MVISILSVDWLRSWGSGKGGNEDRRSEMGNSRFFTLVGVLFLI